MPSVSSWSRDSLQFSRHSPGLGSPAPLRCLVYERYCLICAVEQSRDKPTSTPWPSATSKKVGRGEDLLRGKPAVHRKRGAGDERRCVGKEPSNGVTDLFGFAGPSDWFLPQQPLPGVRILHPLE